MKVVFLSSEQQESFGRCMENQGVSVLSWISIADYPREFSLYLLPGTIEGFRGCLFQHQVKVSELMSPRQLGYLEEYLDSTPDL